MSNESPYFFHFNPKFQLQIHCSLKGTAGNVQVTGVSIMIFLGILTASSPVSHTYFYPRRENKKQTLNGMCLTGQCQSVEG